MFLNHPLLVANLLNTFDEIFALLTREVRLGAWLNAYLLAAGLNQAAEDFLHPDPLQTGKIAKNIVRLNLPARAVLCEATQKAGDLFTSVENLQPKLIRLLSLQQKLSGIVQELADIVIGETSSAQPGLQQEIQSVISAMIDTAPQLSGAVLKLPSCFRSFDQQPEDIEQLVHDFAERWPERFSPLGVVGVRTSGSYLAPLCVSYLKSLGYRNVSGLTFRPGRKFLRYEKKIFKSISDHGGMVLVIDDPPATGSSLLQTAKMLENAGIPGKSIVLLLQLFGPAETLPSILQGLNTVLLPWQRWAIHDRLAPVAIHMMLDEIFAQEYSINSVTRLPLAERKWVRSHVRALYEANVTELKSGRELTRKVFVEGAGLGYYGEHSLAVKSALRDYFPEVYGYRDGLLFRDWLPEENRVAKLPGRWSDDFIKNMVGYVQKRHQALAVLKDVSLLLKGENSSWEVASNLLSKAFGKGWMVARLFFVDGIARQLLDVKNPSVIDGKMGLDNWFIHDSSDSHMLKIGFSERDFSNLDLYSYDPVFDLAGLASVRIDDDFPDRIRQAYQELSGEQINPERWLLYCWIHLWDRLRLVSKDPADSQETTARLFQNYFHQIYFKDLEPPIEGPICAFDVDGVLETNPLGFAQLTPSSALTLRSLLLHGFRPVLATGRSLPEVQDRCKAYALAGGVAEYGAAIYNHTTGNVMELLSEADCRNLDRLRTALSEIEGVYIDPNYQYAVRAYRKNSEGNRRRLSPDDLSLALEMSHLDLPVRIIPGQNQTDFMVASIDKGKGLRCLLQDLSDPLLHKTAGLVFSVGDSASDLPMFSLAPKSFVPGHADPSLAGAGVQRMAKPYQAGVAQAAEVILGHRPGTCPICSWQSQTRQRELFLNLLSAQESGTWGMLVNALKLSTSSIR